MIKKSVVTPSVDLVVALGDMKGLRTCVNYTRYRICMNMVEFVFLLFYDSCDEFKSIRV